ncbi:MAG: hypothetical protein FWF41_06515 [Betaproteobacteria bacterium]|nr:hypothetical protein [Betaproteobacteria bacterium]
MFSTATSLRRRDVKHAFLAVALALTALSQTVLAQGSPGIPQPGSQEWVEDFSLGFPLPGAAVGIGGYAGDHGETYTVGTGWASTANQCNGWILNSGTAQPGGDTGCSANAGRTGTGTNTQAAWPFLQAMASVLGLYQGQGSAAGANNVLASMTNPGTTGVITPISSSVQIQANSVFSVTTGHYYIASADFAEIHCQEDTYRPNTATWYEAAETISLLDSSALTPLVQSPTITPCSDAPYNRYATTSAGTPVYVTTGTTPAWLATSSVPTVGIQVTNGTTQTPGNDVALDDLQIIDVTPQLDEAFSSTSVPVGGTTTLTFTITNTDDLLAKTGWSFNETLPSGLTFATTPNITTDCPNGLTSILGTTLTVSGDLAALMISCTVTVDVTSATPDTYDNDDPAAAAPNVTGLNGLLSPGTTSVTFFAPLKGPAADPVPTGKALPWLLLMLLTAAAWFVLPKTRRSVERNHKV